MRGLPTRKQCATVPAMSKTEATIRKAIARSADSRYRIAEQSGVSQGQLSRFVSGERGLSIDNIEKVADALGLEIVVRPKPRRKAKKVTR